MFDGNHSLIAGTDRVHQRALADPITEQDRQYNYSEQLSPHMCGYDRSGPLGVHDL